MRGRVRTRVRPFARSFLLWVAILPASFAAGRTPPSPAPPRPSPQPGLRMRAGRGRPPALGPSWPGGELPDPFSFGTTAFVPGNTWLWKLLSDASTNTLAFFLLAFGGVSFPSFYPVCVFIFKVGFS